MADVEVGVAPATLSIDGGVHALVQSPSFTDPEILTHLAPHRLAVVELDEYRTRQGWPVAVPRVDSQSQTLASAQGYILSNRPDPGEVVTTAACRWIAGEEFYDPATGVWRPFSGYLGGYRWKTTPDFAPSNIANMPYFVGKELYQRDGVNFDAGSQDHFWSDFKGGLSGTTGYTVIMAVILNSAYGNTVGRQFMGIWGPGHATGAGDTFLEDDTGFSVLLENSRIVVDSEIGENHDGLVVTPLLSASRVCYLAFSLGYPYSTVWGSLGVGRTTEFVTHVGQDAYSQQLKVVLGRSTGSVLNTADMTVMDIGLYDDVLTFEQVEHEISLLAASYGG